MPHRKRNIILLSLMLLVAFSTNSYGQRWKLVRYQVGIGFGTTQLFGDIGGTASKENLYGLKDIKFDETSLAVGGYARYKINTLFSVKANLNYGRGKGTDLNSRNDRGRSYKANFFEFSGQYEYYFLSEEPRRRSAAMFNKNGMINNYSSISAYAFIGVGVTYSILQHEKGTYAPAIDDYKSTNIAPVIPFGVGAKYVIDEQWFIGAEFGYRYALSDYVEGYKQTQSSEFNDIYYFFMFTANYRLKTTRRNIPLFMDRKFRKFGY